MSNPMLIDRRKYAKQLQQYQEAKAEIIARLCERTPSAPHSKSVSPFIGYIASMKMYATQLGPPHQFPQDLFFSFLSESLSHCLNQNILCEKRCTDDEMAEAVPKLYMLLQNIGKLFIDIGGLHRSLVNGHTAVLFKKALDSSARWAAAKAAATTEKRACVEAMEKELAHTISILNQMTPDSRAGWGDDVPRSTAPAPETPPKAQTEAPAPSALPEAPQDSSGAADTSDESLAQMMGSEVADQATSTANAANKAHSVSAGPSSALVDTYSQSSYWTGDVNGANWGGVDAGRPKKRAPKSYAGLANQGSTCYLNSLIQTLYMTPEFRSSLYAYRFNAAASMPDMNIPYQLQRLFARLQIGERPYCETKDLTHSFNWGSGEVFEQHDAMELNQLLRDALEHAFRNNGQHESATFAERLYRGRWRDEIVCGECHQARGAVGDFYDISVGVRGVASVEAALRKFLERETLEDVSCEHCGRRTRSTKGFRLLELPYLLTIQLKRSAEKMGGDLTSETPVG